MTNQFPYPEPFLRAIAQEVDTPEGKRKVAVVPRYEVGGAAKGSWIVPLSKLQDMLNQRTLEGGRLITILPQGAGACAPVFLYHDEFMLPEETEEEVKPLPPLAAVEEDSAERRAWEADENPSNGGTSNDESTTA